MLNDDDDDDDVDKVFKHINNTVLYDENEDIWEIIKWIVRENEREWEVMRKMNPNA